MKQIEFFLILMILNIVSTNNLLAQHTEQHADNHEYKIHNNHIALLIGATTNLSHNLALFSLGFDYEHKTKLLHNKLGIGFGSELLMGQTTEILAGIPIFYHPLKNFTLLAEPLISLAKEHNSYTNDEAKLKASFAIRVGTNYNIHINKISVSPVLYFDFGETISIVYGLGIGIGF
ncbi:MAG: hypothetical protein GXO79_12730 [Chlorobi bacterium]|nr:hypothetical protein [Chlorobiota bacterium]